MPKWIGNKVGTAVTFVGGNDASSAIYNLFDHYYAQRLDGWNQQPEGLTATGGVISDYTDPGPGAIYRAHVFTSSGSFNVTATGSEPTTVDYLVVGGGGGGGSRQHGGGGGAGLLRYSTFTGDASPGVYTITVGAGGNGGIFPGNNRGVQGSSSSIAYPEFGSTVS